MTKTKSKTKSHDAKKSPQVKGAPVEAPAAEDKMTQGSTTEFARKGKQKRFGHN